jgi:hypothetical protein
MTINFGGIQTNTEGSMFSTFLANKYGCLISFCITSNYLYVVIVTLLHYDELQLNFSADGNYEVTLMTKATVYFDGRVIWEVRRKGF